MSDFDNYRYDSGDIALGEYMKMTEPMIDANIRDLAKHLYETDFAVAVEEDRIEYYLLAKRAIDWMNSQSNEKSYPQKWIPNGGLTGRFPSTTYVINNAAE